MADKIVIKGACEHNLKCIDVEIPRDRLIVITGVSGSGKSTLAFDTIYAEGQRRYVESLSTYARQFLELMDKPDVESIEGLSPAIAIEQKTTSKNPRSTVGTVTEIYDYLRLLFARAGQVHCPECDRPITTQTVEQMVDRVLTLPEGTRLLVLAPIVRGRKGEYRKELRQLQADGYARVRIDGSQYELTDLPELDKQKKHAIEVIVDRLVIKEGLATRLAESLETALRLGEGLVQVEIVNTGSRPGSPASDEQGGTPPLQDPLLFSARHACVECGVSIPEIAPRTFSFNSPHGACPQCTGLGIRHYFDPEKVVPDPKLTLRQGALAPWSTRTGFYYLPILEALGEHGGFDLDTSFQALSSSQQQLLLGGSGREKIRFHYDQGGQRIYYQRPFEGVLPNLERRLKETDSEPQRERLEEFMSIMPCPVCGGARLKPAALAVRIGGKTIRDLCALSVTGAQAFFATLELPPREAEIARRVLKEVRERLAFLAGVGLDYLTLDRTAGTLSGGEGQRIRLATQVGSSLVGVLYILDEPSIGLHQRDNRRLLDTLKRLRDLGNTVLVVEHDEETILEADHVIDMGPGAGVLGGRVVAQGPPAAIVDAADSLTGDYLAGRRRIPLPTLRRLPKGFLVLRGAGANNLRNIDVNIPLGVMTCVTGVSGSGKSTLIIDTLYRALARQLYHAKERPGALSALEGLEQLDKVIDIDQSPIGRTPRSNPATYTGVFGDIRALFAQLPEAKLRGYPAGRFSFNVRGGRCEACQGDGLLRIEMHFLPDVYVQCEICKGARYNRETLEVRYKGKNIADVLAMTASQAVEFLGNVPVVRRKLETLCAVGLGYITLGQSATTLSGGEAQRVKLAKELGKRATGRTIYILDEPTTGLHFDDIRKLLEVLQRLVDAGNTVLIIEHNLDVIKCADHLIDLGPEGGYGGGLVVAAGTPEEVAACIDSHTGRYLQPYLGTSGGE